MSQSSVMDQVPPSALSLLSLAAAEQPRPLLTIAPRTTSTTAPSIPTNPPLSPVSASLANGGGLPTSPATTRSPSASRPSTGPGSGPKHRRMSSAGQRGRRLSEATAATAVAFVRGVSVSSTSGLSAAAATLSLSSSPPSGHAHPPGSIHQSMHPDAGEYEEAETATSANGKKKVIYRCETCSKAYRHPNCLLKHRWEHSPHWREASKFLLSKHQQVQLLEAAAILSHISPNATTKDTTSGAGGTSLPDDRSLWPSYLSGGLLPTPASRNAPPVSNRGLNKVSNLTASKDAASGGRDESTSGEDEEHRDRDSGYGSGGLSVISSSLPTSNNSGSSVQTAAAGRHAAVGAEAKSPSPTPAQSTLGGNSSTVGAGFYYGSVGNMPTDIANNSEHWSSSTAHSGTAGARQPAFVPSQSVGHTPFAGSASFTGARTMPYPAPSTIVGRSRSRSTSSRTNPSVSTIPPPPYHRSRPSHHRHSRGSSSISSSYTRSSARGDGDDEDEDEDEDEGFLLDIDDSFTRSRPSPLSFGAPLSGASSYRSPTHSLPSSFSTAHQAYQSRAPTGFGAPPTSSSMSASEDFEFGVLDERDERDEDDTVDEESDDGDGAGMEIDDMEL